MKMPNYMQPVVESDDASMITEGIAIDMDRSVSGDPGRALVIANSMIAAARMILRRYDVDERQRRELYREFWLPLISDEAA